MFLGLLSVKSVKACVMPWLIKKDLVNINWLVRYGIDIPYHLKNPVNATCFFVM